jgi:hypothetical protein
MEEMVNTTKKDKLKNKKKDIITQDNQFTKQEPKKKPDQEIQQELTVQPQGKEQTEKKVTFKDDIEVNTFKPTSATKETKAPEISNKINKILTTISFNIQLLLSLYSQVDDKLYAILSKYLSPEHVKNILEERDCRSICGNMLCGQKLQKPEVKKYYYDSKKKDFIKDDIIDYFCDIKCLQKFKDLCKLSQAFDYFSLMRLDFLIMLSVLPDYFPEIKYIDKIATLSKTIIEEKKPSQADIDRYSLVYQKYFTDVEDVIETDQPIIFI